ncbi:MAG: hypothetical protein ACRDQ0_09910, partial [Pseudonocardia sp.]
MRVRTPAPSIRRLGIRAAEGRDLGAARCCPRSLEAPLVNVPLWLWFATIGGLVAIILADLFLVDHT